MSTNKQTPKQVVTGAFPKAYGHQQPSGGWVIFDGLTPDNPRPIGQGSNPNNAWKDAEIQLRYYVTMPEPTPPAPTPDPAPVVDRIARHLRKHGAARPGQKAKNRQANKNARRARKRNAA